MAKKKSSFINMVLTLSIITAIASLALGGIYNLTKEPIEIAKKAKREAAIKEVIPDFDSLLSLKVLPEDKVDSITFYHGFKEGEYVGTAVSSYSNNGYDPTQIQIMVGFLPDGTIHNTVVTQHKETPGLGTKMNEPVFKEQFKQKHPDEFTLIVVNDGGDVDAITAATISSRAFCEAVAMAYENYTKKGGPKK
jgi:electron transport complex protein RnfG